VACVCVVCAREAVQIGAFAVGVVRWGAGVARAAGRCTTSEQLKISNGDFSKTAVIPTIFEATIGFPIKFGV